MIFDLRQKASAIIIIQTKLMVWKKRRFRKISRIRV
jgi:hypothetical protein